MCLFMFVLLFIYHGKYLRQYLSKTNGYVVLKRKCYPLYMRKQLKTTLKFPLITCLVLWQNVYIIILVTLFS